MYSLRPMSPLERKHTCLMKLTLLLGDVSVEVFDDESVAFEFPGRIVPPRWFPSVEVAYGYLLGKRGFLPNPKDFEVRKEGGYLSDNS